MQESASDKDREMSSCACSFPIRVLRLFRKDYENTLAKIAGDSSQAMLRQSWKLTSPTLPR